MHLMLDLFILVTNVLYYLAAALIQKVFDI